MYSQSTLLISTALRLVTKSHTQLDITIALYLWTFNNRLFGGKYSEILTNPSFGLSTIPLYDVPVIYIGSLHLTILNHFN